MHPEDPLLAHAELLHQVELYPLGFALRVATNSPVVLRAAEDAWGGSKQEFPYAPLEMRIVVHGAGSALPPNEPVYRAQRYLFVVAVDNRNFGICDLERGYMFACMTPAVAAHRFFQYHMLEWMVYFTIDHMHIAIMHAACVARNGRGVLLCGYSGAGKSCLTYACVRRGWTLVADDFCAPVRGRSDRMVIGRPEWIRVRPEATSLFPELAAIPGTVAPNGKPTLEIKVSQIPNAHTSTSCLAEAVVFLDRRETGPAELMPISIDEALDRIQSDQPRWNSPVHDQQREARLAILSRGARLLRYSDFDEAITLLESLVGREG